MVVHFIDVSRDATFFPCYCGVMEMRAELRRYLYRCERRGGRELDLLLGGWARETLPELGEGELCDLGVILDLDDGDLWSFFCGDGEVAERLRLSLSVSAYALLERVGEWGSSFDSGAYVTAVA
ncbi:MAG: succinate dehydrogenase assembly factor 2, partial [Alphaproteobacteria bacterium]|nr:succinate dehydrogenase assembly factor 2 [Alphaproteobacteria bacterium]